MAIVPMKTHKSIDTVNVKFLVFQELVPSCILGIDGQDQLKIKLDREQDLIWMNSMPITLHQSEQEAKFRLGAVSLEESFGEKIERMSNQKQTDYYKPNVDDDQLVHHAAMSYEVIEGSSNDVEVDNGLSSDITTTLRSFLEKHEYMFGYFDTKVDKPKATVTTAVTHHIVTDGEVVSARPYSCLLYTSPSPRD